MTVTASKQEFCNTFLHRVIISPKKKIPQKIAEPDKNSVKGNTGENNACRAVFRLKLPENSPWP